MENNITLESLIQEHKERIGLLKYKPSPKGCIGFGYHYYEDSGVYQKWLVTTRRFIDAYYPNDKYVNEFESVSNEKLSPEQQNKLLAILEAIDMLPTIVPNNKTPKTNSNKSKDAINITTNINNNNSQSQNQEQSLDVNLFIEAIRDYLTGYQIKELIAIVAEADNDFQKARPSIVAKLKEFGTDVASNIIANILTNPIIWGGL